MPGRLRGFTPRKAGFTLIELLVVIAIIAILAAILFPVFARARESARRSACLSNMKQVALGLNMYAQDYDERFPVHIVTTGTSGQDVANYSTSTRTIWINATMPYVKNTGIWWCPSATPHATAPPIGPSDSNYYYNGHCSGKSLAAVEFPADSVLFAEWKYRTANTGMRPSPGHLCPPPIGTGNTCPDTFHPNSEWGSNHVTGDARTTGIGAQAGIRGAPWPYVDGHVKFRPTSWVMQNWKNF
jgi:prepilin-type N-terminal cleavage/methylation domain-containing protein